MHDSKINKRTLTFSNTLLNFSGSDLSLGERRQAVGAEPENTTWCKIGIGRLRADPKFR